MVEEKGIEPHVPVWEKAERKDGTFSRSDFSYDAVNDEYTCPAGKLLKPYWTRGWKSRSGTGQDLTLRYHARKKDCEGCALKEHCCPNPARRKVTRSVHEAARDEFLLTATAQNLRRMANYLGTGPPKVPEMA